MRDAPVVDSEQWDAFVIKNGGNFLQSWGWGLFQEARGRRVSRRRGVDGTVIQGSFVSLPLPLGRSYLFVPRGPVIDAEPDIEKKTDAAARMLRAVAVAHRADFVRAEFLIESGVPMALETLRRHGFVPAVKASASSPADTVIVDLRADEARLLADMHPKTRYNIRVASRRGVTVRGSPLSDDAAFARDFDLFWRMLSETADRDAFHTHPREYYETMLRMLGRGGNGSLRLRLYFAEHEGKSAAAAITVEFDDSVTYLHGASVASMRNLMAPHALHWQIMLDAKARGFSSYDFWGVAPIRQDHEEQVPVALKADGQEPDIQDGAEQARAEDDQHPWAGITRFKRGFGGKHISYVGTWELPVNRFWYTLYRQAKGFLS